MWQPSSKQCLKQRTSLKILIFMTNDMYKASTKSLSDIDGIPLSSPFAMIPGVCAVFLCYSRGSSSRLLQPINFEGVY